MVENLAENLAEEQVQDRSVFYDTNRDSGNKTSIPKTINVEGKTLHGKFVKKINVISYPSQTNYILQFIFYSAFTTFYFVFVI